MIIVECAYGTFKLDNGVFVYGPVNLRLIHKVARRLSYGPEAGPVDYAIAQKMMNSLNTPWEIKESEFPKLPDNVVE